MSLHRRLVCEGLGSALLLATVIGSGIMGERLADGNIALTLLANTLATGAGLVALILTFGPISGAHFNPAVTLASLWLHKTSRCEALAYIAVQILGAFIGVAAAHLMFGETVFSASHHVREGWAQSWSEFVASFGLISVVISCSKHRPSATPFAVAAYITAAYWFTASTSFANPAVTLARATSDSFAGIRPMDVPAFVCAQITGTAAAVFLWKWLLDAPTSQATESTGS